MSEELDVDPINAEEPKLDAAVAAETKSTYIYNQVDQEMADEYGWTPQQAKASRLYLQGPLITPERARESKPE